MILFLQKLADRIHKTICFRKKSKFLDARNLIAVIFGRRVCSFIFQNSYFPIFFQILRKLWSIKNFLFANALIPDVH